VALFMVGALWLVLRSRSSTSLVLPAAAGLAIGIAYLIKETAVFAFVPLGLALRPWVFRNWTRVAAFGVAFALVLAAEAAFWTTTKGDPFYRSAATSAALETVGAARPRTDTRVFGFIPGPRPFDAFRSSHSLVDVALMLTTNEEFALFGLFSVPVLFALSRRRDPGTRDLRIWLVTLFLLFAFLPVVEWPRYTLPRDPRYYSPLAIPLMLAIAVQLTRVGPVPRAVALAALLSSSVAATYIGAESSRMEPQVSLADRYLARQQPLWATPQIAADLLFLSDAEGRSLIRVHLLEQTRRAGSYEAIQLVRPATPVADDAAQIRGGLLVLQERNAKAAPSGWERAGTVAGEPSRLNELLQQGLRTVGLPVFANRIAPGGGRVVVVYRCRTTECLDPSP
jgi:hypothetical protein